MTARRFYDWQTGGGADDVVRLVEAHPHLWARLPEPLQREVEKPS